MKINKKSVDGRKKPRIIRISLRDELSKSLKKSLNKQRLRKVSFLRERKK